MGTSVGFTEGTAVGDIVGGTDGTPVGDAVGTVDGTTVGSALGATVGSREGSADGSALGPWEGQALGITLGTNEGPVVGCLVGTVLGVTDGVIDGGTVGRTVGTRVDVADGALDGVLVGAAVGALLGTGDGGLLGARDETADGVTVGVALGTKLVRKRTVLSDVSETNNLPLVSPHIPRGALSSANVARPPFPVPPFAPVPAIVMMLPVDFDTTRILLLIPSTIKMLPLLSPQTPYGPLKVALVGLPPSPLASVESVDTIPVPANVEIIPSAATLRTTCDFTCVM